MMNKNSKIYVAGHRGMVGSSIIRALEKDGYSNIVFRTSAELNLTKQDAVTEFFETEKPEYVFLAAAKVGGILANNVYRADFLYHNLMIEANIIHSAYKSGVAKLLFLGSSCIYPKLAPQPLKEEYLLTGLLEQTNEPYAIAKIAGIKLCETYRDQYGCNFISVIRLDFVKKRMFAPGGIINKIAQYNRYRQLETFVDRTNRKCGANPLDTEHIKGLDIGAVIDLVGRYRMIGRMAVQEN